MPIAVWVPDPSLPGYPIVPAPIYTPPEIPADWTFAAGPWTGLPDTVLSRITSRRVTWRTTGLHDASFTVDGTLPEAASIQDLITDVWVYRNQQVLYRGRVGVSSDTADAQSLTTQVTTGSYGSLLGRRYLADVGDSLVYSSQDKSAIAWGLITTTQGKPGGNYGIIRGIGQTTGATTSSTFQAGTSIGDMVSQVATGAFDWDITPIVGSVQQTFDVYFPLRGTDRQKIVDYPGQIAGYTRTPDPSTFANVLRVTGTDGLGPQTVTSPTVSTDGAGRFEAQYGDTSISTVSQLTATANQKLADAQLVIPSWTLTLAPDIWGGPNDVWLGDPVTLAVNHGRLNVLETLRVMEISLSIDDDSDTATVSLTLGTPPPENKWRLRNYDKRLTALERR